MKLLVGLGNPGIRYKFTRHNIGFRVVEAIVNEQRLRFKSNLKLKAKLAQGLIDNQQVYLFKSLRFMNLCGLSLAAFVLEHKINIQDILVICDCLDLPFGALRLKNKGSDAGHRGMRSIIASLGADNFSRLKIGIGRPLKKGKSVSDFVLSRFTSEQERCLPGVIKEVKSKVYEWLNAKEVK